MELKTKTYKGEKICFVTAIDGENRAEFRGYLLDNGIIVLECFLRGNIGKYRFIRLDDSDTFSFKGEGRGRKPQLAIEEMRSFIKKCIREEIVNR